MGDTRRGDRILPHAHWWSHWLDRRLALLSPLPRVGRRLGHRGPWGMGYESMKRPANRGRCRARLSIDRAGGRSRICPPFRGGRKEGSFVAQGLALCMVVPLLGFSLAAQQSPAPVLPADVPKDADVRVLLIDETPSGQDAVWTTPDGTLHELFQFNDRGRGPKIYTTYRLDAKQLIAAEDSKGVDYMKAPVEEHFAITSGQAVWKNQAETERWRMPTASSTWTSMAARRRANCWPARCWRT